MDGFAASLAEAAIRFAIAPSAMGTILVGMATPEQFETALAAVEKGPLPQEALIASRRCNKVFQVRSGRISSASSPPTLSLPSEGEESESAGGRIYLQ